MTTDCQYATVGLEARRGAVDRRVIVACLWVLAVVISHGCALGYEWETPLPTAEDGMHSARAPRVDLAWGYGYSYAKILGEMHAPSSGYEALLSRLGQRYAYPLLSARITVSYQASSRVGVYFGVPLGFVGVDETSSSRGIGRKSPRQSIGDVSNLFGEPGMPRFGVGDAYFGTWYELLPQRRSTPSIMLGLDVSSASARYSALGDGVWDYTAAVRVRRAASSSRFLSASLDYTYRAPRNGVDFGDLVGYGAGLGSLRGSTLHEVELRASSSARSRGSRVPFLGSGQEVALVLSTRRADGRHAAVTFSGLQDGINLKRNAMGFEWSIPIRR